jgi:hypothetical protein
MANDFRQLLAQARDSAAFSSTPCATCCRPILASLPAWRSLSTRRTRKAAKAGWECRQP